MKRGKAFLATLAALAMLLSLSAGLLPISAAQWDAATAEEQGYDYGFDVEKTTTAH